MNTQFFELFWLNDRVWGVPIDAKPTTQYRAEYDNCFSFVGKTACFFFVTSDDTIRREAALEFAATIAAGRFTRRCVDLSQIGRIRKNVQ